MGDLRSIRKKVKPVYGVGDDGPKTSPLVRNYIGAQDMDFISWKAQENKGQPTSIISVRVPDDLLYDMEILIDQKLGPFRTKTEFVRTAIHVLMNYYGLKAKSGSLQKRLTFNDLIKHCEWQKGIQKRLQLFQTKFMEGFQAVASHNDEDIGEFLDHQIELLKSQDGWLKDRMVEFVTVTLTDHGIDPSYYVGEFEVKGE